MGSLRLSLIRYASRSEMIAINQAQSQILMNSKMLSVNQAYALIVQDESKKMTASGSYMTHEGGICSFFNCMKYRHRK